MRSRVFAAALLFLCAPALPAEAQAQRHPIIFEGHVGHASFVDDSWIGHSVFGASARVFVTPRVAIGPEITFMRGPDIDRDWFITGNVTVDLTDERRAVPYFIAGGGVSRSQARVGTGPFTSSEGTFTAGAGVRLRPRGRLFIAPEFRMGWELHFSVGVVIGVK